MIEILCAFILFIVFILFSTHYLLYNNTTLLFSNFGKGHLPYELDNYNNLANIKLAKEKLQSLYFYYQKVQCLNYSYSMKIP
ncbi:hypothetical protein RIR_jg23509.t1 [Rhizophagus irregularis DAOM 181602=DAOM 197198]|nr:hypothetical protein RIR_jg23509.t1 [Rhizophagus irregularis DAOM 181602=DAOM 197198]